MKTLIYSILTAVAILIGAGPALAQDTFIIGVAPHTSARVILQMYQPLRMYLEKSLAQPVEVRTAPDFNEFARRALQQEYDLAITTGHQARLLQTDAKYLPLLTYKAGFKTVAIVAAKGPINQVKDLKGKNVLGLSAASLVTLWGQHWLARNGLGDIPVRYVSASDSVAQLVISGEAAAGFISSANFDVLTPEVRSRLRIIAESPLLAGRVYVLNNRWAKKKKTIDEALWEFAKTPEARQYFETKKLDGYRKLKPKELEAMDPYAAEVRKILAAGEK
jgi:phosphonate transport system substrate-binding protein